VRVLNTVTQNKCTLCALLMQHISIQYGHLQTGTVTFAKVLHVTVLKGVNNINVNYTFTTHVPVSDLLW
jgi:predicted dithiol-disulfide oxidoreductase (DUF899 family)